MISTHHDEFASQATGGVGRERHWEGVQRVPYEGGTTIVDHGSCQETKQACILRDGAKAGQTGTTTSAVAISA